MEQSRVYKRVEAIIKDLERQLALCTAQTCEASGSDAKKEIEEHFARCINALAERKEALLREVDQRVANKSMFSLYNCKK